MIQLLTTLLCAAILSYSNVAFGFQSARPSLAATSRLSQLNFVGIKKQDSDKSTTHVLASKQDFSRHPTIRFLSEQVEDSDPSIDIVKKGDKLFDLRTTLFLVGGQSLLIGIAAVFAKIFNIPNFGVCKQTLFL